jgi:hypothetical protein
MLTEIIITMAVLAVIGGYIITSVLLLKFLPVNYFIVLLPTKYLFIVMQISEYDITNEIGEHSYNK